MLRLHSIGKPAHMPGRMPLARRGTARAGVTHRGAHRRRFGKKR